MGDLITKDTHVTLGHLLDVRTSTTGTTSAPGLSVVTFSEKTQPLAIILDHRAVVLSGFLAHCPL